MSRREKKTPFLSSNIKEDFMMPAVITKVKKSVKLSPFLPFV